MESIRLRHKTYDRKLNAMSALISITMDDYINLTSDKLRSSYYQRKVLPPSRNKVFKRLIEDLKQGATVPPISIALIDPKNINKNSIDEDVENLLKDIVNEDISILDGIQRTNCFIQVKESLSGENLEIFLKSEVRVEVWINIPVMALLYRMVVLNAGQTNMSLRHQLEILNYPLKKKLHELTTDFELYEEGKEQRNRVKNGQFRFGDVIEAFLAFVGGDPDVDKNNEVAQRLEKLDFLSKHSNKLEYSDEEISHFAFVIDVLDKHICDKYTNLRDLGFDNNNGYAILGSQPTLVGLSAAWGAGYQKFGHEYMVEQEKELISIFEEEENPDPLGLSWFAEMKKTQSKRVGDFERKLVYRAFYEYIERKDKYQFDNYWEISLKRVSD